MPNDDFKNIFTLASAIGNVIQAINNAEKNNLIDLKDANINYLLNQKNELENQIKKIYNEYINLKKYADELKDINNALIKKNQEKEKEIENLKNKINSLKSGSKENNENE